MGSYNTVAPMCGDGFDFQKNADMMPRFHGLSFHQVQRDAQQQLSDRTNQSN